MVPDAVELEAAAAAVRSAFPDPWLRAFSVKANDVAAVVRRVGAPGFEAHVVSRGERARAARGGHAAGGRARGEPPCPTTGSRSRAWARRTTICARRFAPPRPVRRCAG